MREGIHPNYVTAQATCACGNTFTTRSTMAVIRMEICSQCHPFFTGKQKLMDTAGRVERFQKRFSKTDGRTMERKPKTVKAAPQESKNTRKILRNVPRVLPPAKREKAPKSAKPSEKAAEKTKA